MNKPARIRRVVLRSSAASLMFSKAVIICLILVAALIPTAWVLFTSASQQVPGSRWELAYQVAALVPLLGAVFTMLCLAAVTWKKARPAAVVTKNNVRIGASTFRTAELARVQVYSRMVDEEKVTYLALLPGHTSDAAPYTTRLPEKPNHQVFEFVEILRAGMPDVAVDKYGLVR